MSTNNAIEKYSSAYTLSDMEIFVYPDLMYALVLANIMSPRIWKWKKHPFLKNIHKGSINRKIQRLKQFIMDNYHFNLDLETWGLTNQKKELKRFQNTIDINIIEKSNALFGYHGDKHYFELDIRKHFGLDKYNDDVIPYWKTETIEAMDAFRHKDHHQVGAGECVSLSALYAAALFIILKIPLEDIFLMATPLHSQNFLAVDEGIVTNNRRILTKKMWFNGTELSQKARRAIENENITIVSHISGYVHLAYNQATIDQNEYRRFTSRLSAFLVNQIDFETFTNFLRIYNNYQDYFQFEYNHDGHKYYISASKLFKYEHTSKNRIGNSSYKKFLQEIELEEFSLQPLENKDVLNVIKSHLNGRNLYCCNETEIEEFKKLFQHIPDIVHMINDLKSFVCMSPNLPIGEKDFIAQASPEINIDMTREEIISYLDENRNDFEVADLAFYISRQFNSKMWTPYLKASIERNPCIIDFFHSCSMDVIYEQLKSFDNKSIYDEQRIATPDEVINFKKGCGLEKAVCMINIIKNRNKDSKVNLELIDGNVILKNKEDIYKFHTDKELNFKDSL